MNQDRSHLFRRVRELTGQAPSDLIRDLRLDRAAELLRQHAGAVGEIAYAVGFNSVAHFTKAFRERHGRTLGQYRDERADAVRSDAGAQTLSSLREMSRNPHGERDDHKPKANCRRRRSDRRATIRPS